MRVTSTSYCGEENCFSYDNDKSVKPTFQNLPACQAGKKKKTIRVFHEFEEVTSGMKTSGLAMRVNSVSYSKENCFPYDSDKVG